ncbi:MAG: FecCD family ABC transporter permease [Candidatus Bathyarchaeia archaeon]
MATNKQNFLSSSKAKLLVLIACPLIVFFVSLFLGVYPVSPQDVFQTLFSDIFRTENTVPLVNVYVINLVRIPRAILALTIGAGLAIAGASNQGMLQNPLVSPDILGVSAAASFGAVLVILLGGNTALLQISAFSFGLLAVGLTYLLSRVYKTTPLLMLVLSGVVISAFFSALIGIIEYVAPPNTKLQPIVFWLLGGLTGTTWDTLVPAVPLMVVGIVGLLLIRWRINLLALGDDEARSLGVRTERLKGIIIIFSTITVAAAVTVSGLIGWVGLIIPHIGRMLVGSDHKALLPACVCIGSAYLLVMDDLARTLTSGEIPLGILTALLGAPFFLIILRKTKGALK